MINWVKSSVFIEPGLRIIRLCVRNPELPNRPAQCQRGSAALCEMRDKSPRPSRGEQSTLARIHSVHCLTNIPRIRHGRFTVRVHPQSDGARTHMVRFVVDKSSHAFCHIRERFQTLHRRTIIACMKNRYGRKRHEIEQCNRRPLSIQFGKETKHTTAKSFAEKRSSGRPITSV